MRRLTVGIVAAMVATFALPALAAGSNPSPGVHVDPGSPAGKQYQIPITSARHETSGSSSGATSAPAFGTGVTAPSQTTPAPTDSSTSASTTTSSSSSAAKPRHHHARTHSTRIRVARRQAHHPPARTAEHQKTTAAGQVGSDSWAWLAAGGALVLLLGCGGGLLLRHRW